MSKKTTQGQIRLQREGKMSKKDIDTQIKKKGKLEENFICLPDPTDAYHWYFIMFGIEARPYKGGYYLGEIICPDNYPASAPKINMITHNGRLEINDRGICMSISSWH